jgi:putative transposase
MARQPRLEYAGAFHHVMSRGNDGIPIFRDDADRVLFLEFLGEEVSRSRWLVHEYSLMGNHFHLAIETPECTLSTGMHRLLARYAQRFNRRHKRRGHLFQERFKNVLVENESYGLTLSRYIALNAVKAELVARPEDWRWCSYAARIGMAEPPSWLTIDPLLGQFGSDRESQRKAYRTFVLEGFDEPDALADHVVAGMFLGTAAWIERMQEVLDQTDRSVEHPRAQVHPGRPELDDVLTAVAQTFDTTVDEILESRGTLERRMVGYFAFEEGLLTLHKIAEKLKVRSRGGMSGLVARFRREITTDPDIRGLADACRQKMRRRPPPFLFPPEIPPVTARHYHRAAPRSRR